MLGVLLLVFESVDQPAAFLRRQPAGVFRPAGEGKQNNDAQ